MVLRSFIILTMQAWLDHQYSQLSTTGGSYLDLVLALFVHHLLRFIPLFGCLDLADDLGDFDPRERARERVVECELVIGIHFAALGVLDQHPVFAASKGLQ
jgi:hypothetical protein